MTKKDYVLIADVLGNKLQEVTTWTSIESKSLSIAYVEDFIHALEDTQKSFDRVKFIQYINKKYKVNLLEGIKHETF